MQFQRPLAKMLAAFFLSRRSAVLVIALLALGANGCINTIPEMVFWAWEKPEDLRAIDSSHSLIAVLDRTIFVNGDAVAITLRRQPVQAPPNTSFIAVVRIVTQSPSAATIDQVVEQALRAANKPVEALQIDYDAGVSERPFYTELLKRLRQRLPKPVKLSMTALASWCQGDRWIAGLPVDEVVPMLFRLGPGQSVPSLFSNDQCRKAAGISLDERDHARWAPRIYLFSPSPWNEERVRSAVAFVAHMR